MEQLYIWTLRQAEEKASAQMTCGSVVDLDESKIVVQIWWSWSTNIIFPQPTGWLGLFFDQLVGCDLIPVLIKSDTFHYEMMTTDSEQMDCI